ncbi:MAG: hypothetical protein K2M08_04130 [Anaeroplasmataceae bacterium]|nr:hypothetical protein [Anaeroplasmataceae bacterium]
MSKLNIRGFKIFTLNIILLFCLVLCSCKDKKTAVIPPGGGDENDIYRDVYYKYDTYEEMILGSEVCERKQYSYQFNFQLGGVEEYSYYLMARKKGGKKTEDEEITSDVLIERYVIIGRLDKKRKFSIIFGVFGLKESMEERLQGSMGV